jgi:hypothetical protein
VVRAFDRVAGVRRVDLVHLRADGSLDPDFRAEALGRVSALALRGDTLYVGGAFDVIGGEPHSKLAALDARTGEPRAWNPGEFGGEVLDLSLAGDRRA